MAMLGEEGEFPLGLGPVRRSGGIAKVAQRPDHLGDATGIVTEDLAEPVNDFETVTITIY